MKSNLYMEINLAQIKRNIEKIKNQTKKDVIVVVKSNAYGLGDIEISQYLEKNGVEYIAVVDMEEAIHLCQAGIKMNILILNSLEEQDIVYLEKYSNLMVSIHSYEEAKRISNFQKRHLKVHIQIDTSMNRQGFLEVDEVKKVISECGKNEYIILDGIYTHFTDIENVEEQERRFLKFMHLANFKMVHLAASSIYPYGTLGNYVRVGLNVYGDSSQDGNKQCITIKTKALEIRHVKKGATVGYLRDYQVKEDMKIAILPIGYSHGYQRKLKNFHVLVNEISYPIIGIICMNHLFVKVDEDINLESEFIITSPTLAVKEIADYLSTISHEVLCMFHIKEKRYVEYE